MPKNSHRPRHRADGWDPLTRRASVPLSHDTWARIYALGNELGVTASSVYRLAIEHGIDLAEAYIRTQKEEREKKERNRDEEMKAKMIIDHAKVVTPDGEYVRQEKGE